MERHEIETFLTLAEELHFGRTAARLGLAQGRVSQTVKKLERRFGAPLFVRTTRQVALTGLGRALERDLRPAYRLVQEAVARAVAAGRGVTGRLRVGYSSPWAGDRVNRAVAQFRRAHPECEVGARQVQQSDPFGPLRSGELDLQLSEFPVAEDDLSTGPALYREPRALMVPADHPFARRASVGVEDLAEAVLVPVEGAPEYWREAHYPRRTPGGRPIPQGPSATFWPEVLSLVATGHGVSPIAARGAAYHARPGIVFVPFADAPSIEYGLIWATARRTAAVEAFARTLQALPD
ncbi:LysR family transcriptional regulator [Kitasatospora sp. NPDC058965]|uniref:LysR family transcriptional regulator n=1 Tax=Kitasatospora sp. NPDC058965 TaxID=3346682 RepID=UPI0036A7E15B